MSIQCQCNCGRSLSVPEKFAGQAVKCPQCGASVGVPQEAPILDIDEIEEDGRYSIREFLARSAERDRRQGVFELESERLLEINLDGMVWTKMGSMVAYLGNVKFTREGMLEHGLGSLLKKSLTGEGTRLTKAEGKGKVYLADVGKKVTVLELADETICVNGNDLLAFEMSIKHEVRMMRKMAGMLAGGIFNIELSGTGMIAITTHYDPLVLKVTEQRPVYTDPNATVAWSGDLAPDFKTDISFKTFFGRGSGESIQMKFQGDGWVVVQPFEEVYFQGQ
jgi:uncharacterized protein (AIM24 family)